MKDVLRVLLLVAITLGFLIGQEIVKGIFALVIAVILYKVFEYCLSKLN